MMVAKAFVDTNVVLRSRIVGFDLHTEAEVLVEEQINKGIELWKSRQIIREYFVQITRPYPFMQPFTMHQVEAELTILGTVYKIADETAAVTAQLMALLKEYTTGGKQIHDANIVATMLVNGIDTLLTGNIEDMKRFENKITLIPLKVGY